MNFRFLSILNAESFSSLSHSILVNLTLHNMLKCYVFYTVKELKQQKTNQKC